MKTIRLALLALISAVALTACGESPTGPRGDNVNAMGSGSLTADGGISNNVNALGSGS